MHASLGEWLTAGGLLLTAIGVFYAGLEYRHARLEAVRGRTLSYVTRYSEPDLVPIVVRAEEFLKRIEDTQAEKDRKWAQFNDDAALRATVLTALNYYEGIGAMYNRKLLDNGIIRDLLGPAAVADHERASWFIKARQEHESKECWVEWGAMVRDLRAREPSTEAAEALAAGSAGETTTDQT